MGVLDRAERARRRVAAERLMLPESRSAAIDMSSRRGYCQLLAATMLLCERDGWVAPRLDEAAMTLRRPATVLLRMGVWSERQANAVRHSPAVLDAVRGRTVTRRMVQGRASADRLHRQRFTEPHRDEWFVTTIASVDRLSSSSMLYLSGRGREVADALCSKPLLFGLTPPEQYASALMEAREAWDAIPGVAFATGCASTAAPDET